MKEIKFRVYDKAEKKMYYDVWFIKSGDGKEDWIIFSKLGKDSIDLTDTLPLKEKLFPRERVILTQYTGLKDKNNREIYEGDIVRYYGDIGIIKYEKCCFVVKPNKKGLRWISNDIKNIEVIGNIYENNFEELKQQIILNEGGKGNENK